MNSTESESLGSGLSKKDKESLLEVAYHSVRFGVEHGRKIDIDLECYCVRLQDLGSSFVTLTLHSQLRGCIGSLEAHRPLVKDVSNNAFSAAFHDPRFSPVENSELDSISIQISVLSEAKSLQVDSEKHLLSTLRPGVDGLIIQDGQHRATYLPSVWGQLPDPKSFVRSLKIKAGLQEEHWSSETECWVYQAEYF